MTPETKLPEFKGKPLIEIPEAISVANFLEGEFGKAFLEEYNGRVKADFGDAPVLKVLSYDNDIVKGSNPFAVVLANQILGQAGIRTATSADLERILRTKALNLRGTYEDSGLVLRSEDEPNAYLAKHLAEQIKALGIKLREPVVIPLAYLGLSVDEKSPHGLSFVLADGAQIIQAPVLSGKNNEKSFSATDENGLPVKEKLGEGERTLYTRNSGLSGLCLGRSLDLYSRDDSLAGSYEDGRVVGVCGEATSADFAAKFAKEIEAKYQAQQSELSGKAKRAGEALTHGYEEAQRVLGGK